MAGAKVPLTFRIFKGDQFVREEKLSLSVIKLGKVPSAHLKLDDETVSRMHAIIEVNGPGDVSIIDLGSTKGTFVNGQKVNKAKLQTGDTIVVGETKIELSIGQPGDAEIDESPTRVQAPPQADIVASSPRPPASAPVPQPAAAFAAPTRPAPIPAPLATTAQPSPFAQTMAPPLPHSPVLRPPPGMSTGPALYSTATAPAAGFAASMAGEADDFGGARAVEVAAMLGDSVVGVKHCIDPKGGKVTSTTWTLFAVGAVCLIAFVFAFYTAVDNAAYNKGRYDYETQVLKKPGYAVRPRQLSTSFDFIAFGGLLAAIVTMTSAISRMRKEKESPFVRIGTAPGVEFPTEGAPSAAFEMVSPHGDDFAFHFGHGMEGEMVVGNQSTSLAELAQQGRTTISPIPANAKIRVRAGKTTFLVSSVPRPRRHAAPLMQFETPFLMSLGGTAAAFAIIMMLLFQIPVEDSTTNIDLASLEDTSTRTNSASQDDPPPPPEEDKPDDGKDESGGTGTAMALDEGKMGKKDSNRAEGQYKMQKTQEDPQLARQQAVEAARTAGILGSTAIMNGGAFASLTGTGDVSSGFDDSNIYGGLLGNEAGEMNGGFGFGRSGFGPGGGGTGWGTIGTGRYGTIGHGSGTGSGYGVGGGRGGMRGRTSAVPTVSIGQPNAQGDLDKAIIRRYIKRNIQKITYCYEKQLLAKPGLSGTVSTQFFISPNGNVTASNGSGVDPEVANCVADVIHGIEFPKPKGGGGVQVNYPFTFRPAGQ
jgi:pSer/pThr/pTyr-binding forkhead associated (FHA) protein